MAGRTVPETANRQDWPRLIAQAVNDLLNRMKVQETRATITLQTLVLTPGAAPASPSEGTTYYDATLHKVRTWDGTTWQNHW